MLRGAGSLVLTAFCIQALAAYLPPPSDPCACSDLTCCRTAKRPAARASCHDDQPEPAASLRCHHPEQDVRLPATVALLPASTSAAPAPPAEAVAVVFPTIPLAGFSRLDLPPPRSPRAA